MPSGFRWLVTVKIVEVSHWIVQLPQKLIKMIVSKHPVVC